MIRLSKSVLLSIVLIVTILAAFIFITSPVFAETEDYSIYENTEGVVTAKSGLRLRIEPNTNCNIITAMPYQSAITIIAKVSPHWYQVQYKNQIGYASSKYISLSSPSSPIIEASNSLTLLSTATLVKDNSSDSRNFNMNRASNAINGTILQVGDEFDFNAVVGHANKQNGYQKAGVLINGKSATDYGGGICQVSSTIYQALLNANMSAKTVYHHSKGVGYIAKGQDATIVYGEKNFVFQNTNDFPLYIEVYTNNNMVTANLYQMH